MESSKTRLQEAWMGFFSVYKRFCEKMLMYPEHAEYYKRKAEKIIKLMWEIEDLLPKEEVEQLYKNF